jgi:type I restriction enzyme S subunit
MTAPKLRFKEFDGDWTLQNLGDSFSLISGYAFPSSSSVDVGARWLKIADVGIQEMTPNNPSYLPLEYLDKYSQFIVSKNDYVIALTRPILNKKLKIAKVGELYDGALLNQRVAKIYSKSNDLDFIYSLLQKSKTVEELENSIAGTDPPNLSLNDVKEIKLGFPSKEEQTKIASFLSAVDEKINQLTQKHQLLSQYKQGMMQKLFSQKMRYKAEDGSEFGEWECIQANSIFENYSNKNHDGSLTILAATQYKGVVPRDEIDIDIKSSDASVLSYKIIEKGNFVISLRSFQGGIEYSNYEGICSPAYTVLKVIKPIDTGFYKAYLKTNDFIQRLSSTVIGIRDGKQISYQAFSTLMIDYPCLEEQTKIANFLSAIDQKIEVTAQQIEQAKQWKKGLLQQMFV